MSVMSADPQELPNLTTGEPAPLVPAPLPPPPAYFERHQARELLEVYIGLPTILEALEFAISSEPLADDSGQPTIPSKFRQMYDHMLNPSTGTFPDRNGRVRYPIDTVMAKFGVKLPEMLAIIGTRNLGMAIAKSGNRLARVIDGLGEAAEPRIEPCPKCEGEGYLPGIDDEPAPMCPKCRGAGELRKFGDLKAAEMFIGLHGGQTSGRGSGQGGGIRDINLAVNAQASAKSGGPTKEADPINVRIQRLIEQ